MVYDLVILGAGAAGMTASIYASRYKINHLIFGDKVGGQFVDAHIIENYPGFTSIDGFTLMQNFRSHVESYGVKIREEKIGGISLIGLDPSASSGTNPGYDAGFELKTETGEEVKTRTLILAMGARHRALNVPGEEHYLGKGVSYCSTCDAPLFKGKVVAVVGGGNSAVTAAIHVSEFASKVYLIHRRDKFEKAEPVWLDALDKKENIVKIFKTQVKEIFGLSGASSVERKASSDNSEESNGLNANRYLLTAHDSVRGIVLDVPFEGSQTLAVEGVFIEIGLVPAVSLANQIGVEVDSSGYLKATGSLLTNVTGVFAAGDLVKQSDVPQLRQIITSAGQGAIAAASVYSFLNQKPPAPDWG